jgi:hypothetical protein
MAFVVTVLCRPLRRGFASQRRPIRQSGMQANKIVLGFKRAGAYIPSPVRNTRMILALFAPKSDRGFGDHLSLRDWHD